ncbi:hypothetical protein [Streptomyces sp. MN13]
MQNAVRAARTTPAATPADHHTEPSHSVDHPEWDAALTPEQRAAMPEEYLEGRTTDPETWMRTPANLERLAAITRAANARRRAIEDRELPAPATDPVDPLRQEHEQQHPQPGPSQGIQP